MTRKYVDPLVRYEKTRRRQLTFMVTMLVLRAAILFGGAGYLLGRFYG